MRVYPAEGLRVPDPRTRVWIPPEGVEVEDTNLDFDRLLRAGDVTLAAPAIAAPPSPEPVDAAELAPAALNEAGDIV